MGSRLPPAAVLGGLRSASLAHAPPSPPGASRGGAALGAVALVVCAAPGLLSAQMRAPAPRPPPLERTAPECAIWKGEVRGNDPSVEAEVRLCAAGDAVTGVLQWSSLRSGWNRRALEGRWLDGRTRLTLRDTRIVEERPEPGYRFCTIDDYDLRLTSPGLLEGTYRSAACRDQATVVLRLEGPAPAAPASAEAPPMPSPAPSPSSVTPVARERTGFCSIDPAAPVGGDPAVALLAVGAALALRRRRSFR